MIAILDYGMGNLRSVHKAFEAVGAQVQVTNKVIDILNADKVVLPGVGAMGPAMQKLHQLDLLGPIRKVVQEGKPFLGICLGMQLLFERSSEGGFSEGTRTLKGSVERFIELKGPHMGWNQIKIQPAGNKMFKGLSDDENVYFCHSYYVKPQDASIASGITNYGIDFVSAVVKDNVWGVQFHPGKKPEGWTTNFKEFRRAMILIPAIDIKGGKVVRLFQGKFSQVTEYSDDPIKFAKQWESLGAEWLHLVDLDGAQTGNMVNAPIYREIVSQVKIPIEIGGGIRSVEAVEHLINIGVKRVIVGTKAIEDKDFLKKILKNYGDKICVSLDCSNGFVAQRGWVSTTTIKATDLALELEAMGLQWMVYTDIARDGTLTGPNFEQLQTMLNTVKKINVIASGGIASLYDVKKLSAMKGVAAAITGKAIYEGKLDFKEAVKFLNA